MYKRTWYLKKPQKEHDNWTTQLVTERIITAIKYA